MSEAILSVESLEASCTVSDVVGAPKGRAQASATLASERLYIATDFLWKDARIRLSRLGAEGAGHLLRLCCKSSKEQNF